MIPVDRGKGSAAIEAMTARAKRALAEGRQVIIFPEGTRRPPLAPPAYRRGAPRLYAALGVPCLPVALNSGLFWPRHSLIHRPGTIVAAILPPIPADKETDDFAAELEAKLEEATRELMEEAFLQHPSLRSEAAAGT
jgi:1-acyl-sn-glycerol-3-phosphate acyltransferase